MSDVPDVLRGLALPEEASAAQLRPMGKAVAAARYGVCRKCTCVVEPGSPVIQCLKFGWVHVPCLAEAQAELDARS